MRNLSRRDFVATSLAVPAGLAGIMASPEAMAAATGGPALDIAEWSFFWTGIERTTLPGGTSPVVIGKQMYIEYQIPARVTFCRAPDVGRKRCDFDRMP